MYNTKYHEKDLKDYSFLITGGAGFIGSNLVEYLTKYNVKKVRVLDNLATGHLSNLTPFMENSNFEFIEGDIRDVDTCHKAVEGMDFVLHQAALGSVPRSINDPITSNAVNVDGFLNMLVAVKDSDSVKRFIYAASSSTYGDHPTLPKVEHIIGKPLSPYAITKYVNELYADVFGSTYGIETIGLRYFNVFGQRQDPNGAYAAVIPTFVKKFMNGESPVINGAGDYSRDFTYIENVVQMNMKAAFSENKEAVNQVYNTAFGGRTTLIQLVEYIKNNLALKDSAIKDIPILHGENRQGDIPHSHASIEKGKTLLNYNPLFSIEDGIKVAIDWYWENL